MLSAAEYPDVRPEFFRPPEREPPQAPEVLYEIRSEALTGDTLVVGAPGPEGEPEWTVCRRGFTVGRCCELVCAPETYEHLVASGAYLVTPGWLRRWHEERPEGGEAGAWAAGIAGSGAERVVLLDTGVDEEAPALLVELGGAVGLPVERVETGPSYFRDHLLASIEAWRAEQREGAAAGVNWAQILGEDSLALEMLSDLPLVRNEEMLVRRLFEMSQYLFSPAQMHYVSFLEGQPRKLWSSPERSGEEPETVMRRLAGCSRLAEAHATGDGFWVGIHARQRIGVVELKGIADRGAIRRHMRLATLLARIFARTMQGLLDSGRALSISRDLAKERDLLRILLDNIPDSIYFKDRESRFTRVNRAQAILLGLRDEQEAYGRTDFDFLEPEFARQAYADEQRLMETGEPLLSKPEYVEGPDFALWMTATKMPFFDERGVVKGLVGISRDVTAWKAAQDALKRSDESLRLLFATIPHAVWVYDIETLEFLLANEAAVRHYGFSVEEFLRMTVEAIHAPAEQARLEAALRAAREGRPPGGVWRHRTKDGRLLEVEVDATVFDFHGRRAVLAISQDITEKKRLQVELQQAQKLEAVGSLAAGIAHEINTPIQYVGDSVYFLREVFAGLQRLIPLYQAAVEELAGRGGAAGGIGEVEEEIDLPFLLENVPESIARCLEGIERVSAIVRAMKSFAHPDQREAGPADLNKAIRDTLIIARNEYKLVAEIVTEFGELPLVPCHIGDLNQVFLNLIVNAAHAIAERVGTTGRRGVIRVATRLAGAAVRIEVGDTGTGIPEAVRERIFEPFFTTKPVGRGSGQGLAIARSIVVDRHGGTLTFETEEGQGTTFVIQLPLGPRGGAGETGAPR